MRLKVINGFAVCLIDYEMNLGLINLLNWVFGWLVYIQSKQICVLCIRQLCLIQDSKEKKVLIQTRKYAQNLSKYFIFLFGYAQLLYILPVFRRLKWETEFVTQKTNFSRRNY